MNGHADALPWRGWLGSSGPCRVLRALAKAQAALSCPWRWGLITGSALGRFSSAAKDWCAAPAAPGSMANIGEPWATNSTDGEVPMPEPAPAESLAGALAPMATAV